MSICAEVREETMLRYNEAKQIAAGTTRMLASATHLRVVLDINEQLEAHMQTMCEEAIAAEKEITALRQREAATRLEREQFHAELCHALGEVAKLVSHSTATLNHPTEAPSLTANVH